MKTYLNPWGIGISVAACALVLCYGAPLSAALIVRYEFSSNLLPNFAADHVAATSYWTASSSVRSVVAGTNMGHPSPGFRSDGWKFTNNYAYFRITVETGWTLTLDRLEFDSKSENYSGYLGPNQYDVRYSTDGSSFTSISGGWKSLSANNLWYADRMANNGGFPVDGLTGTLYLRIYGTGANDSWSYWFHDDVEVFGTLVPEVIIRAGDCDRDGDVDFADYGVLEVNFGTTQGATWGQGDFDDDGDVDFADYQALEVNFGTSIPEPGALSLLALGGLALIRRRRWRPT